MSESPSTTSRDRAPGLSGAAEPENASQIRQRVQALYDAGQCLKAYEASAPLGPLHSWKEPSARVLAGRLAGNLGAYRLAQVLHWQAWRSDKSNPDIAAYHGYTLLQRRGPLAVFDFLERFGEVPENARPEARMHFLTLQAMTAAHLRDFKSSHACLARAADADPHNPWVASTRAHVLELQDRYPQALEAAQETLKLRPWYRPGVQAVAHALQLLDRDPEALALLTEAMGRLENVHTARQLLGLQMELRLYQDAAKTLDRVRELAPLMEEAERLWLQRERVTVNCLRGELGAALEEARKVDEPYYRELAKRLEPHTAGRSVRLDVPFVRQHHMTCAPATLSALSQFWNQPADHLAVAEAICYDGTPAASERDWADTHGWCTREFTVSWEAATALLDRGVPFTLTTCTATTGHLQAVVGYDDLRQTLWLRDPFLYASHEVPAKSLLDRQRSTGPRGMALVPLAKRALLENLPLPDAELYDLLYQAQRGLSLHKRPETLEAIRQLDERAPDHRLTLTAHRALAAYDGNRPALLECIERLLKQFPEDGNLSLARLGCLGDLARRGERLLLLERHCAKPGTDPSFWQQYAQELRADARQQRAATSWVTWALRYRPTDPVMVSTWANLLWDQRQFDLSFRYYRLAAHLGDKNEAFARNFFLAARHRRETEAALSLLRDRADRLGKQSPDPIITLVESLHHLRRTGEACDALEAALARRPEDGTLRLFAADFYGRVSKFERAEHLLAQAREQCPPVTWHRAAAALAGYQNAKPRALEHWREVLELEPLAHDALRAVALLLAETEGRKSALAFLHAVCERFPCSCPLLALRIRWLSHDGPDAVIPYLRQLLQVNPADAWAWRELGLKLAANGKTTEALEAVQEALRLEPFNAAGFCVRADILLRRGETKSARTDLLQAVRLEVDNEYALVNFINSAPNLAERKHALAVVAEELRRQVIFSGALAGYQTAARGVLPPQEVLMLLKEAYAARPDLWQAWSVLVHQLIDVGNHAEARKLAVEATQRYPLLPRIWVDLARVEQARLDGPAEIAALEKALELGPSYAFASRQLAEALERQNRLAEARTVLEEAIAANPLEALNHCFLARVLWSQGERDAAIARLQHALGLDPGYEWAWNSLREWSTASGRPDLAVQMARELTRTRAGEVRSWLLLANCLQPEKEADQLVDALDHALVLDPRCETAFDAHARCLATLNRFEEALAQCSPPSLQPAPPQLRLRAAWIEARRGNIAGAIEKAQALLQEHPDFYNGWQLVADWFVQRQQLEKASHAAQNMADLAPLRAMPLGYVASLKLRLGDREGARASFQRAFSLDPEYTYAGFELFALQIAAREHDPAASTLKVLNRHGENAGTCACAVELAMAQGQTQEALHAFERLCSSQTADQASLARAGRALQAEKHRPAIEQILEKCLQTVDCPVAVADFWVEHHVRRGRWGIYSQFPHLMKRPEAARRAFLRYLDLMGDAIQKARRGHDVTTHLQSRFHLWRLLKQHRAWLSGDVEGWGKVGYVLSCIGRPDPVIAWLGDWRTRPKAESWMLHNLVVMLQRKGRYEECREIIKHAVVLRHGEDLYEVFCLWAAFEDALAGDAAKAQAHLASLPARDTKEQFRPIRSLAQILVELHLSPALGHAERFDRVRRQLCSAFGKTHPSQRTRYVRDAYRRFLRVVSRNSFQLWLWGSWYYRGERWFWLPALMVLVPLAVAVPPFWILLIYAALRRAQRE